MSKYILSVDIGTSSAKTVLFDTNFNIIAHASKDYDTKHPQLGWAEQDPENWWQALIDNIQKILSDNNINAVDIAVIGIDSFSTTVVSVDKNGNPLRDAIIWQDRRAVKQADWIEVNIGSKMWDITGNISDAGNVAPKIMWIKENELDVYKNTHMFLHANSYLVYKLTGKFSMDKSQVGLSQLCDTKSGKYSDVLIDECKIDSNKLPDIYECTDIVGNVNSKAAKLTGLAEGIPVIAGSMDNVAAGLGVGMYKNGEVFISGGTVTTNNICLTSPKFNKKLHIYPHIVPNTWIMAGCTDYGGGAVKWLNEEIFGNNDVNEISELIEISKTFKSSIIFLPYMVGQRSPLWNNNTSGVIFGLKPTTTRQDLIRAAIEGTTYGSREVLSIVEKDGLEISNIRITGGSSKSTMWVQTFADVLNKKIQIPGTLDLPPLGIAIAAAYSIGIIDDFEQATNMISINKTFYPNVENQNYYNEMYEVFCNLYQNILKEYDKLSDIDKKYGE